MQKKFFFLLIIISLTFSACNAARMQATQNPIHTTVSGITEKTPLVLFAAGSLIIPFQALETAFEEKYPQIDILAEYHGSIQVMRHVTEMHDQIDVVVTADSQLIPMLMYAVNDPESGLPYADWYINFATNRLAIAYTATSKYGGEINAENWVKILSRPDVIYGISDPRFDPAGYRALMAFALQEQVVGDYGLFKTMFKDQFVSPITIFREDESVLITIPEILDTTTNGHVRMRGSSIQLIAMLESGDLDYAFEYESVIRQHQLSILRLDEKVDLSSSQLLNIYDDVEVKLDFQRFQSVEPHFFGEPITYGITIPTNAKHQEAAELFLDFLFSESGQRIMNDNHHPMFETLTADGYENLPLNLQTYCTSTEAE